MEKTLFGIKFTLDLKYLYDSFLPPPPGKPATFGIVHLENIMLKKEAQKGKSSLLENIQNTGKPRLFHPKYSP